MERESAKRLDTDYVREMANGQWPFILDILGVDRGFLRNRHGPCPACGGRDRFRFDDKRGEGTFICSQGGGETLAGDGFTLLLHQYPEWDFIDAKGAVAECLGIDPPGEAGWSRPELERKRQQAQQRRRQREAEEARKRRREMRRNRQRLTRIWSEGYPPLVKEAEPLWRYLATRGLGYGQLKAGESEIRFHPRLPYYEWFADDTWEKVGEFPAMLALIRDPQGRPVTIHRTYLARGGIGKAPVSSPRKLLPGIEEISGGAIRLAPPTAKGVIGVTEGIEDALAVHQQSRVPTWPCISADMIGAFQPPEGVRGVVVFADLDRNRAGQNRARDLVRRLDAEGYATRVVFPPVTIPRGADKADWNDALLRGAPFPDFRKKGRKSGAA